MWPWPGRVRARRGRPFKMRWLMMPPTVKRFTPVHVPPRGVVYITPDELEAFRLAEIEGLSQEDIGNRMRVSRGTVWRLLSSAKKKLAMAIVNDYEIIVSP